METMVMERTQASRQESALTNVPIRSALFLSWLGVVSYLVTQHAMFRDEVRAYSFAVQGANTVDMLRLLRGEGHPALWYLLLRGAHALVPSQIVLPVLALLIAATAVGLLVFRSGMPWPLVAALLCTHFILFEYAVVARNYGITMLLLFLLAVVYPVRERRPWLTGSLLFLIANTNVHSVLLAVCFVLFLGLDQLLESGWRAVLLSRTFRAALAGVALGAGCCFVMVRAPFNDAAQVDLHQHALGIARGFLLPGHTFGELVPRLPGVRMESVWTSLFSLILVGSTLILIRSPGALAAALAALFSLSLLFTAIYSGRFRHEALWLVFLLTLYWIVRQERAVPPRWKWLQRHGEPLQRMGVVCALFLLIFQVYAGAHRLISAMRAPESDSRAFAGWMHEHPEYRNAWIVADPDYLVEPVRYYLDNPTYLLREHRPGSIVIFSRYAQLTLTLGDVVAEAKALRAQHGQPVLILLDASRLGTGEVESSYNWLTDESSDEATAFRASTELVATFPRRPVDEVFEVFALR